VTVPLVTLGPVEIRTMLAQMVAEHVGSGRGSVPTGPSTTPTARDLIRDLLIEGAKAGEPRDDVAPDELATYCLHALTAAGNLRSKAAVQRLLDVTLSGYAASRLSRRGCPTGQRSARRPARGIADFRTVPIPRRPARDKAR